MHEFPKWKILKLNFLKKTFLSFLNYCSIYYLYPTANYYFLHFPASLHGDSSYTLLKKEVHAGKKRSNFCHTFGIWKLEYIFFSIFILFIFIFPSYFWRVWKWLANWDLRQTWKCFSKYLFFVVEVWSIFFQ